MIRCEKGGGKKLSVTDEKWEEREMKREGKKEREREMVGGMGGDGVRADRVAWHFPVRTNCSEKSTKRQRRGRVTLQHQLQICQSFSETYMWHCSLFSHFCLLAGVSSAHVIEPNEGFHHWLMSSVICWNRAAHFMYVYSALHRKPSYELDLHRHTPD